MKVLLEKIYGVDSDEARAYEPILKALISRLPSARASGNVDAVPENGRGLRQTEMVGGMGGQLMTREAIDAVRAAARTIDPNSAVEWMNRGAEIYRSPESYLFRTSPDSDRYTDR